MNNINPKIEIDYDLFEARVDGKIVHLPRLEFEILSILFKNRGKVCTRSFIERQISTTGDGGRIIDVYVGYLRNKLGKDYIKTRRQFGYFIEA